MRPQAFIHRKERAERIICRRPRPSVLLEPAPQEAIQREPRTRGVALGSGVSLVKSTIK